MAAQNAVTVFAPAPAQNGITTGADATTKPANTSSAIAPTVNGQQLGATASQSSTSAEIERNQRLLQDLQGVVGVGNAVAARSLQQLAENGQRKLQAQTGDSLGPFIPGDGAGRNSRATRVQLSAYQLAMITISIYR